MTFDEWWASHRQFICICPGQCLYRIFVVNEGWVDEKARKRLLSFLQIEPGDPMPPEYIDASKTSLSSKNQVEPSQITLGSN